MPIIIAFVIDSRLKLDASNQAVKESVGEFRRRPESEPFCRLAKTAKQAMLVLSSMQPDAGRRKKGRLKPDRVLRQAPR